MKLTDEAREALSISEGVEVVEAQALPIEGYGLRSAPRGALQDRLDDFEGRTGIEVGCRALAVSAEDGVLCVANRYRQPIEIRTYNVDAATWLRDESSDHAIYLAPSEADEGALWHIWTPSGEGVVIRGGARPEIATSLPIVPELEIRAPISHLSAPLSRWAEMLPEGWLRERLSRQPLSSPWAVASCAGLAARLAPRQPFKATLAGQQHALIAEISAWARALDEDALEDLTELHSVRCARLEAELEALLASQQTPGRGLRDTLATWARQRDELASVRWLLEVVGHGEEPMEAELWLDEEAQAVMTAMPLLAVADPWLAEIGAADPDAWWAEVAL